MRILKHYKEFITKNLIQGSRSGPPSNNIIRII